MKMKWVQLQNNISSLIIHIPQAGYVQHHGLFLCNYFDIKCHHTTRLLVTIIYGPRLEIKLTHGIRNSGKMSEMSHVNYYVAH